MFTLTHNGFIFATFKEIHTAKLVHNVNVVVPDNINGIVTDYEGNKFLLDTFEISEDYTYLIVYVEHRESENKFYHHYFEVDQESKIKYREEGPRG